MHRNTVVSRKSVTPICSCQCVHLLYHLSVDALGKVLFVFRGRNKKIPRHDKLFPRSAIANWHKLGGLKQQKLILSQF